VKELKVDVELAVAVQHAAQLQAVMTQRQRSLIEFDETAGRAKYGLGSSAVVVDQAEDIRRPLLHDLETHLVPIVVAAVGLAGRGNPEIPMRVAREAQDVAVGLSRAEASLARTAQFSPSSPNTGSIATMSAEEAADAIAAVVASLDRLTRDLTELVGKPAPTKPEGPTSHSAGEIERRLSSNSRLRPGQALGR
jgi:hypothetical protein